MASLNQRHDTSNYDSSGIPEQSPLLPSIRQHLATSSERVHHVLGTHEEDSRLSRLRRSLHYFLSSKYGHYFVIILVSLDITCIFASFLVSLHVCEHGGEKGFNRKSWLAAEDVLGSLSLAFSSLFMVELLTSLFAFGFRYLNSTFHVLDAGVIVASFVIDVALRGGLEEAGSLIIVLRLWRVFKIIEEFGTGAEDQMNELHEYIGNLQREKDGVVEENRTLRAQLGRFRSES